MKILAVDTTAKAASVCLAEEDKIIGSFFIDTALTHSRTLMPMLEALLDNTETKADELSTIAVNAGPGSFTGVRIGVAAVKGLAFAHNVPCVSVSTLESMAYNCIGGDCIVCAVMDARCSQVYNALFHVKGASADRLCDDRALALSDLKEELLRNITLAPMNSRIQTASSTALAAFGSLSRGETLTPAELMPVYLRLPQAQRELNKRLSDPPLSGH